MGHTIDTHRIVVAIMVDNCCCSSSNCIGLSYYGKIILGDNALVVESKYFTYCYCNYCTSEFYKNNGNTIVTEVSGWKQRLVLKKADQFLIFVVEVFIVFREEKVASKRDLGF